MARKHHKFQTPPPADPIAAARDSSLALRLNIGFFLRQLGIFLAMDLLLLILAVFGMSLYAENRCAEVVELVSQRGVPSEDALAWMEASDYTITPLDRDPEGYDYAVVTWLPTAQWETVDGLRSWNLSSYYTVELPNDGRPYAVTVDTSGIFAGLYWAGVVILICQGLSLISNLFRGSRSIRKVLRPIQDLATTAARLNSMTHMSRREIESLAGELDKIDAAHLDSRIDLPPTQKELRSLAQAINELMDRVNQAYSAQMRFVSDASHELKTPLASIRLLADSILQTDEMDPAMVRDFVGDIGSEAERLTRITEHLLALTRLDSLPAGQQSPVDVSQVTERTIGLLQPVADAAGVTVEKNLKPDCLILCTEDDLSQVCFNLVENAIKYNYNGGRVFVSVYRDGDQVLLEVGDTGVGIPEDDLPKVFNRFYRVDKARSRAAGGTGLGLSIVRDTVRRHGGWVTARPRSPEGSLFTAGFPRYVPRQSERGRSGA